MSMRSCSASGFCSSPWRRLTPRGLLRNEDGAAALEFGLVGLPLVFFIIGVVAIGLYYLASIMLDYGAEAAARKIRTGEAEKVSMTVGQFRELVCQSAGPAIDCGKISVILQHAESWGGISPQACVDKDNNMVGSTGTTGEQVSKYSGSAGEVVLVTLCYSWDLARQFNFIDFGYGPSRPAIIQASTAFKSEPYK
jgi:Flp pilus assembly protein TadG